MQDDYYRGMNHTEGKLIIDWLNILIVTYLDYSTQMAASSTAAAVCRSRS